jgi:hypothetical protein
VLVIVVSAVALGIAIYFAESGAPAAAPASGSPS